MSSEVFCPGLKQEQPGVIAEHARGSTAGTSSIQVISPWPQSRHLAALTLGTLQDSILILGLCRGQEFCFSSTALGLLMGLQEGSALEGSH
ncbi:hypothetical protein ACTXT7_016795 [Hymenolepis weldensis]